MAPKCLIRHRLGSLKSQHRDSHLRPKVIVLSDSQCRHMAVELHVRCRNTLVVEVVIKPNALFHSNIEQSKNFYSSLNKQDLLIVVGDDFDSMSDHANLNLNVRGLIEKTKDTNIVIVGVPYRYDKPDLNNRINAINAEILSCVLMFIHAQFLHLSSFYKSRQFARDGLHLSQASKQIFINMLLDVISARAPTPSKSNTPIIVPQPKPVITTVHPSLNALPLKSNVLRGNRHFLEMFPP